MSEYTLVVPDEMVEAARQIAEATAQPIEQVLLSRLHTAFPLPALAVEEEAELSAIHYLSDDALWLIAKEQFTSTTKSEMDALMDKNSFGTISLSERNTLETLVERGERMMLRKAEAAFVLQKRGYAITSKD